MKGILIRILTALVILASSADVLSAQQSVPCAGNCEWEAMVHHLLEEPEAIYRYDIVNKVCTADLHHLSYMVNIINQIPVSTFSDAALVRRYADFLRLVIMQYHQKADFLKEISFGRPLFLSRNLRTDNSVGGFEGLRLVATTLRYSWMLAEEESITSFEKANYGNLHFLERILYGNDIIMAAKDPYYSMILKRLCGKLGISFDLDTAEEEILDHVTTKALEGDMHALSRIWKDLMRLRFCLNSVWQSDLQNILISYAVSEVGMDEYLLEFNTSIREYYPDEYAKTVIPMYSIRMRSYEEYMNIISYVRGLIEEGKPYAGYLPWDCPEEYRTEGFVEYREAFLVLCKCLVRSCRYEMNDMLVAQANNLITPVLESFGASNMMHLLSIIGNFALDMYDEGYNDAYTIIEDLLRLAEVGYYDPFLMANIATVYMNVSYSKVEEIIDVMLIPNIEYRIEMWAGGADSGARIQTMMLASVAGLTANKDKYLSMAARYVLEAEEFISRLPEEERVYYYLTLADVYSFMGLGYRTRSLLENELADLYRYNKDALEFTTFMSYYKQSRYEDAMKYVKAAQHQTGVTYVLKSMETAFRTGHYHMAEKLAGTYLDNRYLMLENLLMANSDNKSDLSALLRQNDIHSLKGILESSYGERASSKLLAGLIYDWSLISKGGLLKSMTNWHSYMVQNDDRMFGVYDLYNAFAEGKGDEGVVVPREYVSIVSNELTDLIRTNYSWGELAPRVTSEDVISGLPAGTYAVEFCNIADDYYAVLVGNGYKSPKLYRLCSKDNIMSVSGDMFTEYLYDDAGSLRKLYDLIWSPVLEQIPEGSDIYCSLDGVLNLLNVELFCDDASRYVGDVYDIYRVSTTASVNDPLTIEDLSNAVLYGNMNYFMNHSEITSDSDKYIYNAAETRNRGAVMDFVVPREPLTETGNEIRTVSELLAANQVDTLMFEWNSGTEYSFKSLSGKDFDILHMATHGFWWGSDRDAEGRPVPPMKRSGLVLSGSDDEPLSSDKAGVLFAQEIAELDLSAVDLLVLSACQTAGGEIQEDGVFGLQRGFKQAGVGTIVMTLWPVNSAMTQSFMTHMYENLAHGYDTREAFYNARTEVRKHYKKASDWGAFIILD